MSAADEQPEPNVDEGGRSPAHGTPAPVDLSGDLRARSIWAVFLAGPVTWFTHFMAVYLVGEAGCTGDGPGLNVFDPPVPVTFTLVATGVALLVCAAATVWAFRRWRANVGLYDAAPDEVEDLPRHLDDERRAGTLAFAGFLLSAFSFVAVLFTAAPALVLGPC